MQSPQGVRAPDINGLAVMVLSLIAPEDAFDVVPTAPICMFPDLFLRFFRCLLMYVFTAQIPPMIVTSPEIAPMTEAMMLTSLPLILLEEVLDVGAGVEDDVPVMTVVDSVGTVGDVELEVFIADNVVCDVAAAEENCDEAVE